MVILLENQAECYVQFSNIYKGDWNLMLCYSLLKIYMTTKGVVPENIIKSTVYNDYRIRANTVNSDIKAKKT